MSLFQKFGTALRLVARLDFATLQRRWQYNRGLQLLRRHGPQPFIHGQLGFPAVCHPAWIDSAGFFRTQAGDHWEYRLLAQWLESGDQFLDIGANVGLYSFAALSAVGPRGLVVGVDAAPFVVEKLRLSARLLDAANLRVEQAAITDADGEVCFHVSPTGAATTEQSLRPSASQLAQSIQVTVPAMTLRHLQEDTGLDTRLSAVKIDIEGAEGPALRAAPPEWFTAEGPLWIVEINREALGRFGVTPAEILAHFSPAHFECWVLPKHPMDPSAPLRLRPADPQEPFTDSIYYNFFALPRSPRWRSRALRLAGFLPDSSLIHPAAGRASHPQTHP